MLAALLVVAQMLAIWPGGTCPADHFCSPTTGIYGPIVPYTDPTGQADIGTDIRSLPIGPNVTWLAGHAYTQFWAVTMLHPGDVVYAYGLGYKVQGSYIQRACTAPDRPPAPLSLQTSLSADACGLVYIVQLARE